MSAQSLRQVFDRVDVDGRGRIDAVQLQRLLSQSRRLNFSLASVARMIRIFDTSSTGLLDFNGFTRLHTFLENMQNSFRYFDNNASGELDRGEVLEALRHSGFNLDGPAFEALFKAFDPDQNNAIGMTEYIAMASFLRSASATFVAFDQRQQGTISLDFNQWIYASASCL